MGKRWLGIVWSGVAWLGMEVDALNVVLAGGARNGAGLVRRRVADPWLGELKLGEAGWKLGTSR